MVNFSCITFQLFLIFSVCFGIAYASSDNNGCPNRVFIGCVLRLKAQRVPFEKNILNVIFNIGSEARLMHTCKAYSEIMPCFRDKILECGNDKQRRMLNEVGKTLMFLCSPFSVERQRLLIKHQKCVGEILALPATVGCKLHDSYHGKQLLKCREICQQKPSDFTCMLKTWISEQNVCTLRDIYDKCGAEATAFYTDMQSTVFEPQFPVLCDFPSDVIPVTSTSTIAPHISPEITDTTSTEIAPRTIISLPPSGNLIQTLRAKAAKTAVRHKPVDDINNLSNNASRLRSYSPEKTLNANVWQVNYSPNSHKFAAIPPELLLTTTIVSPIEKQYPLVSLFRKMLPQSFPEKFSALFENKLDGGAPSKEKPIAAREVFVPNGVTSTPSSPNYSMDEETEASTLYERTDTTSTSLATTSSTITVTEVNENNNAKVVPLQGKWRPWYLGGFGDAKSDDKFKMPLYHGA